MKACLKQQPSSGGLPNLPLLLVVPSTGQELSKKTRLLHLKWLQRVRIRHGDVNRKPLGEQ